MTASESDQRKARIVVNDEPEGEHRMYANVFHVNHTPWDFALHFSSVTIPVNPIPPNTPSLEITARKMAVVQVPAKLVPDIIRALQENLATYNKLHGKPKE